MKRMNPLLVESLCNVVERFQFHRKLARSDNPLEAETAKKLCKVELWELWVMTQE